jgi:creatinine amidohydrolase
VNPFRSICSFAWKTATLCLIASPLGWSQTKLSPQWEELTGPDFIQAIRQSQGVCVIPFGIIEKHGAHLPLGTDLIDVRYAVLKAVEQEYAVVFPPYYFGQIAEARQQPGTLSYDWHLQLELLQATTDEMSRNGCKKILIANGHGGNLSLLPYFAQSQLQSAKDYVVYVYWWTPHLPSRPAVHPGTDMHAGETETSHMLVARPDLVHLDRAQQESGEDLDRLKLPEGVYTGIWWYAKFPNHYSGNGALANEQLGEFDVSAYEKAVADVIRALKADKTSMELQKQYYEQSAHPLDTKQ